MKHKVFVPKRFFFSIGLLSVSIIAFELVLMQTLSIVQWYHFAYMVISIALLGFGAAGTFLSIFRKWMLEKSEVLMPLLMIISGIAMAAVIRIAQIPFFRFDCYLLFSDASHIWQLVFTYLLFFCPFFLAALAIGLIFLKFVNEIGKLYFANLAGSGAGGIFVLGLIWFLMPQQIPAVISIVPVVSGIISLSKKSRALVSATALISLIIIVYSILNPPRLELSQFKDLSRTLNLPEAKIDLEKNSPYGFIQTVSSPALRYAPGLSLNYRKDIPVIEGVFANGDWLGPVIERENSDKAFVLDYTTDALAYAMNKRERVLVLNAGTGTGMLHAISRGAKEILGVEPNSALLSLMRDELSLITDSLLDHPSVSMQNIESRTFLSMDTSVYDLIKLPMTGSFGGNAGLYALQEQYILTKDALSEMWRRLSEEGVISATCWMDYPVRKPLKLLSTIVEMLKDEGINSPENYIAAVRSWGTITFILKKTPISGLEADRVHEFCELMSFDPAILSGLVQEDRARFNALQDDDFFKYIDEILYSEREKLYSEYDFNIRPATDNRPYFSQFYKWQSIPNLAKLFGAHALPFFEMGYLIVVLTFFQILIIAVVLVILPLFFIGWEGGHILRTLFYFSGIGLGYMFVEIVLIQMFILYFGNPIYAAAAVITSMLVCSGIGSYVSSKIKRIWDYLSAILISIIIILFLYAIQLDSILNWSIALPLPAKIMFAFILIAPVSFLMGMPFPVGISYLAEHSYRQVPWAWGINGCVSVISTAVATIVAVELGFVWVMVFAALAYSLPLMSEVEMRR